MTTEEIKNLIQSSEYDFLRTNPHLGDNIILLGLGGSYAYGTNTDTSDVDIRGVATNSARSILTHQDFEQSINDATDTTIYSFDKIIKLLCSCNPNTIEMLGLKAEQYMHLSTAGKMLLDNKKLFLSQSAVYSFGGYANAQLRRLSNKSNRLMPQAEQEEHILKSIYHASVDIKSKYLEYPEDAINLYIDKSVQEDYDTEIFCDVNLHHYPLRDYKGMFNCMGEIIKSYATIGKRNEKAIAHDKLGKHMMHLVRLYLMCFDILEKEDIITYRESDHDFLMSIRNGKYLDSNLQPTSEFFDMVNELEKRLEYDKKNTSLPKKVDTEKVYDLVQEINGKIVFANS